MILVMCNLVVYAQNTPVPSQDIKIIIDGELCTYEDTPIIISGSTFLPLRSVAVSLGVSNDSEHIIWDDFSKSVRLLHDGIEINLKIGSLEAKINGSPVVLNAAPVIYNERTYVPLRFIAESFKRKVVWDDGLRAALITTEEQFKAVNDIIQKSSEVMLAIKKAVISTDLKLQILQQDSILPLDAHMSTRFDRENKKLHLNMSIPIIQNLSYNTYFVENTLYEQNMFTGKWTKRTISDQGSDILFEDNIDIVNLYDSDSLCAGLVARENTETGKYILEGNIYLVELFNKVNENSQQILKYELARYYTTVYIDKNTYMIDSMVMDISGSLDSDLGEGKYNAEITSTFSDINGDIDIKLPEGI